MPTRFPVMTPAPSTSTIEELLDVHTTDVSSTPFNSIASPTESPSSTVMFSRVTVTVGGCGGSTTSGSTSAGSTTGGSATGGSTTGGGSTARCRTGVRGPAGVLATGVTGVS